MNNLINERFIRLSKSLNIKQFDCEDEDLNDFFINDSLTFSDKLLAVTYVIENDTETVAFFSIFNDKVSSRDVKGQTQWESWKSEIFSPSKNLRGYPAVKIGRLGVHCKRQGKGYGKLIIYYLIDSFINNNKTGCRFITVDAYRKSLNFYLKTGFKYLTEKDTGQDTRLMYLDLFPFLN